MSSRPTEIREIGIDSSIEYKWMDETPGGGNLGHAEFIFCPLWVRGIMRSLFIYPRQQHVEVGGYRLDLKDAGKVKTFSFSSHHGDPRVWIMSWCPEHKSVSYRVYVPRDTNRITFEPHFGDSLDIEFGKTKPAPKPSQDRRKR